MGDVVSHKHWGLEPLFDNIPGILKKQARWVNWRAVHKAQGKTAKQPMTPAGRMASSRDKKTWSTFERVKAAYEENKQFAGVGFVITDVAVDLTVLDLDNAYDPIDGPYDWAQELIDAADSYTEVSPSDRGIRIFVFGDAGAFTNNEQGLEVYTSRASTRYLTVTGHVVQGRDTINPMKGDTLARVLDPWRPPERPADEVVGDPISDNQDEIELVLDQLFRVDRELEHYEPWLQVGMALHHQFDGAWVGCDIWQKASQHLDNFDASEMEAKWDSFGKNGGRPITLRTIYDRAKGLGIRIKPTPQPATADEFPDLDGDDQGDDRLVPNQAESELGRENGNDLGTAHETKVWRTLGELAATPPPKQMVEDLLAMGQVSQISGEPGAGKTFVAMELAYGVATGTEVFGLRTVASPVLYLAYEGVSAMEQRVRAWKACGRKLPTNIAVISGREAVPVTDAKAWMDWLLPVFKELKPRLVIVDTFAAASPGMSTNDEEKVGAVVRSIRNLAEKTHCHVMTIHHPPKGGAATGQKSRGSGIIEGDLDTQLWVSKTEGTAREWEVSKQRSLGSYGLAKRWTLKTIETGMETQWGVERAPYLDMDVVETDSYAPELLDLTARITDKLAQHGNTSIDAGQYNSVMEAWLAEHYSEATEDMVRRAKTRAKRHLHKDFEVEESGNNRVKTVAHKGQ